ncbi:MAG: polysaccharide deacetylase family protein [Rhodobacter sp.]|nr:polysaccharide deacetylase family protein [Rhodobacter sp.]MCY4169508.1 polysaccharide deacetylase family protein [Rhodobacter sp.]
MPELSWPRGKTLAFSIVTNVEEGSEMSVARGDKKPEPVDELGVALGMPIRNYGNESNYYYGITTGGPRILKLLRERGMVSTFTAAAQALEAAPDLTAEIVADGHEVCSHGWRWTHTFNLDEEAERITIRRAADSIEKTCGVRPSGWLSRYLHTDNTRRLLVEEGFDYHMDDYSRDVPFWERPEGADRSLLCVPYALDTNDMKMWIAPALSPDDWLDYAKKSFDWMRAEAADEGPRMMSVGLHLRIVGRPGRIGALRDLLDYVAGHDDVWIARRSEIAARFAECCPEGGP